MDVDLAADFDVKTVENLGEKHGYGSFADGFEMRVGGSARNNARFIMGGQLSVEIEWLFNGFGFNDLTFKLTDCYVEHGDLRLFLIKDECYSDLISAQPLAASQFNQGLSFTVFKNAESDEDTQDISCSVRICEKDRCARRTDVTGCDQYDKNMAYTVREINLV